MRTAGERPVRPRIVVVGAGFAGHQAARTLLRRLGDDADVVVVNPTDHFLYLPLLPEVAAGTLEPRRIAVSLAATLPGAQLVLGKVDAVDVREKRVGWVDPEGRRGETGYDWLVLAAGSVTRLLPVPGIAEYAHGFRGIAEALYVRDHVTRQIELAAVTDDAAERAARCTFVVVGAGYTGTEVAAQGALLTAALVRQHRSLHGQPIRWILLDRAPRVLPGLDERLSRTAHRVLVERGVEVRVGESVEASEVDAVRLTTGERVDTRTLVWCVGVRPDPLVAGLGLPTDHGRLVVDPYLAVPDCPDVVACGDAAAVPDLTRPGHIAAMTAQHAVRQGRLAGHNVAASLGHGRRRRYRHHDLGFLVELGGRKAAANPLGVPLSGIAAAAVTRSYHLLSLPGNRLRIAADWMLNAVLRQQTVQLGLVRGAAVPLESARRSSRLVAANNARSATGT
ncbi:hypothetical protein GCM10009609_75120 [Pseudonocardia aurantiaca]|uniref:NAD(P)/FAD-dependent oxidoreductase n=1 Tax=Pseudonocardia aurantiaca TaxID=75290 RepID=A0ABW4FEK7_9PSEU